MFERGVVELDSAQAKDTPCTFACLERMRVSNGNTGRNTNEREDLGANRVHLSHIEVAE